MKKNMIEVQFTSMWNRLNLNVLEKYNFSHTNECVKIKEALESATQEEITKCEKWKKKQIHNIQRVLFNDSHLVISFFVAFFIYKHSNGTDHRSKQTTLIGCSIQTEGIRGQIVWRAKSSAKFEGKLHGSWKINTYALHEKIQTQAIVARISHSSPFAATRNPRNRVKHKPNAKFYSWSKRLPALNRTTSGFSLQYGLHIHGLCNIYERKMKNQTEDWKYAIL